MNAKRGTDIPVALIATAALYYAVHRFGWQRILYTILAALTAVFVLAVLLSLARRLVRRFSLATAPARSQLYAAGDKIQQRFADRIQQGLIAVKTRGKGYLAVCLCIIALLLAILFDWAYAYYVLLRLAVCVVSVYCAMEAFKRRETFFVWAFGANAVLFNPILPIHMARSDWQIIDFLDALFLVSWVGISVYRGHR